MKKIFATFIAFLIIFSPAQALTLNIKNMEMSTLIDTVSQVTGKNFIVNPRVKGRVNVVSTGEIDDDEFYHLFLSILQVHGYIVIEGDEFSKILPQADTKNNSARITSLANDSIITTVIPIKNVAASQMIAILRPIVSRYGHIAAYAPSNTIVLIDTRANLARLQNIIQQLDTEIDDDYELISLKNASAEEVSRIIKQLLPNAKNKSANPLTIAIDKNNNQLIVGGAPAKRLKVRFLVKQLDKKSDSKDDTKVIYLKYAKAKDIVPILQNVSKQLLAEKSKAIKQSVNIQADETTNSIIITGQNQISKNIESIISKLDIRRAQVLIEAIIAEVSTDDIDELGINWGVSGDNGIALLDPNNALTSLLTTKKLAPAPSGIILGGGKFNEKTNRGFATMLTALRRRSDTNILSTPSVVTIDNEEATILVGENIGVITGSQLDNSSQRVQTYKREDVGVKLKVKPQINAGDTIKLEIEQEISSVDDTSSITDTGVVLRKRTINTSVMVENKKILVLGGLISDDIVNNESGVPFLSDIPLLGNLFKYSKETNTKRNLLIFIHPTILTDQAVADSISTEKYNFILAQRLLSRINDSESIRSQEMKDLININHKPSGTAIIPTPANPNKTKTTPAVKPPIKTPAKPKYSPNSKATPQPEKPKNTTAAAALSKSGIKFINNYKIEADPYE